MIRTILGIILIACGSAFGVSQNVRAQVPGIKWEKCLGGSQDDQANCIVQTFDGGFAIAGTTTSDDDEVSGLHSSAGGKTDAWVVKLDATGTIQWQKCLGGSGQDGANSIIQTTDGGFAIAGYTQSNDGDVSGFHGGMSNTGDGWVVKLNSIGTIQWQKCLGGNNDDWFHSIVQTADGGFVAAGSTYTDDNGDVTGYHGSGTRDCWVVKLSGTGTLLWEKCRGGSGDDFALSITKTTDGGFAITGLTTSNDGDVSGFHGGNFWDAWVAKLNDTGAVEWQKCLGGTSADEGMSVIQTADGGYAVACQTLSNNDDVSGNHGLYDYWIVKLNATGAIQWQKCLGEPFDDFPNSIIQTSDGGYAIAGSTESNGGDVSGFFDASNGMEWVVKVNNSGEIQWQKCLGGTSFDVANSIIQTFNGNYVVAGSASSNDSDVSGNHGGYDAWIVDLVPPPAPTVAYITPDAGAPGMCVAVEIVAPVGSTGDFGPDGLHMDGGPLNGYGPVQLVNASDSSLVRLGPGIVSWNGRIIQQMIFIEPSVPKLDTSIQLEVVVNGQASTPFTFHILAPRHVGTLTGGGVIGANIRTARNTMIVDSMILTNGTYTIPTTDPDPSTAGNQAYLPMRILSNGPIRLVNASISANGQNGTTNTSGGAGGPSGGGGGSGYPGTGGAGYTGGGGNNDNTSGPGGTGTGSVTGASSWIGGSSLSGATGGNGEQHSSSGGDDGGGGGAGHPFGTSGTNGGAGNSPAGGHGGGSAGGSNSGYTIDYGGGGGGNFSTGTAGQGSGDNSGQTVGNSMLIPLAGGSGGGAGNVTYVSLFGGSAGGSGGGGGGAIELTSFADFGLTGGAVSAAGGTGSAGKTASFQASAGGGGGSGGAINVSARDSIVISTTGSFNVFGGNGGASSSNDDAGGIGAAGRVRLDGYVSKLSGNPSSANYFTSGKDYTGPSIQKVTFEKNNTLVVSGHGASWDGATELDSGVTIYMSWPSLYGWSSTFGKVVVDPASHTSSWSDTLPWPPLGLPMLTPADSEIYIVALQFSLVPNVNAYINGTPFVDTPSVIMGHTSGIIVKVPAGPPKALVNTRTIDFGNITVGKCSDDTTFEVYSVGASDLNITSLALSGPGAAQYFIKTQPPIDVKHGDSVAITIVFCPTAKACPITATLTINNNDTIKIVQLTGCGIQPQAAIHPLVIDFGRVHVGDCKDTTVMLVNPGTDELTLTKEDLVNPTYFTILDPTPLTLAAGDSTPLHLRFCPKDTSIVSTIDSVISNAPQSPILVTLIGGGRVGILSIPAILDFGLVHRDSCVDSGFYAVNNGNDTLLVTSNQIAGPNFTVLSPSTPFVIQANDTVFVSVKFCSPDTGSFSATETLVTDIPDNTQIILLAHTGFGILSIPNTIDFGNVPTGGCVDSNIQVSNTGTDTIFLVPGSTLSLPFSYQGPSPFRIAPGVTTTIDLRFCPTDTNGVSEIASFNTIGFGISPSFTLLGKGIEGAIATSGPIDIGCIAQGTSVTKTITLKNTGAAALTSLSAAIVPNGAATIVHNPPATLATGASDSVVLIFVGTNLGSVSATLSLTWSDGGSTTLPITAQVSVPPSFSSSDSIITFDTTKVGDSSIEECVRIANYSCVALRVDSIQIISDSGIAGEFEITASSNVPSWLADDSSTASFCIRYKPQRGGPSGGQAIAWSGNTKQTVSSFTGNGIGTAIGVRLAIDTIAGRPGDIVNVPVRTLNDVTSAVITSLTFRVTFDPMQLDLKAPVSPFSVAQQGGGNIKNIVPPLNPISGTYSVKRYSIGDQEITATYSSPLTGMPIVAELPFEILLPTANTASVHLLSATFGTSQATLSTTNDGLIQIEQCDTNERIALQVNPVDVAPIDPNPFNSRANVALTVNTAGHVRMEIFNALGELMMTNFDADVSPGSFAIDIDASSFATGSYRCVTTWSGSGPIVRDEKTMVVMR